MSKLTPNQTKNEVINNQTKTKKIGYFSAILLVVCASIGAGIFLKNKEILANVQGSWYLDILCWIIAITGIIAMALTLPLLSSASKDQNNDLGIIDWVKNFCHKYVYVACKNFMSYIYLPANAFIMSFYFVYTIQGAFGWEPSWWLATIIALAVVLWFTIVSGLSSFLGNVQNWLISLVKFLPIIFAGLIGFISIGMGNSVPDKIISSNDTPLFNELSPAIGIFASIPAIFFAFDGFYSTASFKSQLKKPEKISSILAIGLAIVSALDILITVSLILCSKDGTIAGINTTNHPVLIKVIQVVQCMIGFGILGIINAFSISAPRYYETLISCDGIILSWKFKEKLNPNRPVVGTIYCLALFVPIFIILTLIGAFAYLDTSHYNLNDNTHLSNIYSLTDCIANWTSLLAFGCITIAIIGSLVRRKQLQKQLNYNKKFTIAAYVCITIIGIAIGYFLIATIANIALLSKYYAADANKLNDLIGAIMALVILLVITLVSCSEIFYLMWKNKKHFAPKCS